jgi:hypothetical protein
VGLTKGICQAFHFVKQMDTSSSDFTTAVLYAQVFSPVILSALKTGGDGNPYTHKKTHHDQWNFTSFQVGGSSNGSSILPKGANSPSSQRP